MAQRFRYLIILLNFHQMYNGSVAETEDFQKKFTSKCDDLCINQNENGTIKDFGKSECLRGCQYFNIEFLLNARNKDKTVDLNQLVERCGSSCSEAYEMVDKSKKESCFRGCNEMAAVQAEAPAVNGWLVYMGATDRNMVLLQPDFDIPSKEDWVLLDSIFRANDYDYNFEYTNYDKILKADSRGQIDSVSRFENRFTNNYCIPSWMWILPLLMLVAFIYYRNYIYIAFIHEGLQHEFGIVDANHFNAIPMSHHQTAKSVGNKKVLQLSDEYIVGSDYFFYPAPAVPLPKYNDVVEAILTGSSDDEDDSETNKTNVLMHNPKQSTNSMARTNSQKNNDPSTSII